MFEYRISEIAKCMSGSIDGSENTVVNSIITDSRSSGLPVNTIFIALHGPNHNGHDYLDQLIVKGVKNFVVDEDFGSKPEGITTILVNDTLVALQDFATEHRNKFTGKVIGITGSNGKTIVKEWLESVLSAKYSVSKSPKSYNSQVGVALSILQSNTLADIHILEAGISKPDEMDKLARMIQAEYGLITNIGDAHQENFVTQVHKLDEKLKLFTHATKIFYCSDHTSILENLDKKVESNFKTVSWGSSLNSDLIIKQIVTVKDEARIKAEYQDIPVYLNIPFQDKASIENLCHIWSIALDLGIDQQDIQDRVNQLEPVAMRMEQKEGINACTLINDFYNSDFRSVNNAIDLLIQQTPQSKKTLIISDILQTGEAPENMINKLRDIVSGKGFNKVIGIGEVLHRSGVASGVLTESYPDTKSFLDVFNPDNFNNEAILLKAARRFTFEEISSRLELKVHRTVLRINMPTLLNNLNSFRNFVGKKTKIMGMVKAFSYGSGSHELARFLAHQNIDYLAVAFVDEGIILRQAGVKTPIMVMNPDYAQSSSIIEYHLEPEIFNLSGLRTLKSVLAKNGKTSYPIHLEIDTGMHRLGFLPDQLEDLIGELKCIEIKTQSIFSHLAAADSPDHDEFTLNQIMVFESVYRSLSKILGYMPLKHILNTTGIERFPDAHFDMVRLGIGLYGIGAGKIDSLESPIKFESYISQIHYLEKGETIGYGRMGKLEINSKIAIIPVGYADGFDRRLGHGKWSMTIGNQMAPTIGQICMDMCMLDITEVEAHEGDVVTITGGNSGILKMSKVLNTIPYEILTGFSQRIKRIYEFD